MDKVGLKLEKVLKIMGIGLFIGISILASVQVSQACFKSKSTITCDGADASDTIIVAQERFRGRMYFDLLKKTMFIASAIPALDRAFQSFNSNGAKCLLVNAYQRNVFYVYAFSTVP